jgi:hypothetical protein
VFIRGEPFSDSSLQVKRASEPFPADEFVRLSENPVFFPGCNPARRAYNEQQFGFPGQAKAIGR